jgi:hypothetical protein
LTSWTAGSTSPKTQPTTRRAAAIAALADEPGDTRQRKVGIWLHGVGVGAQRQRRCNATVMRSQVGDHGVPERRVHEQSIEEHEHRTVVAGFEVLDSPAFYF